MSKRTVQGNTALNRKSQVRVPPNLRVLVVDDDRDTQMALKELLTHVGLSVLLASDGLTGLDVARRVKPDIIILDLLMPGVDGLSFRRAQLKDRELARIPVVVLTAAPGEWNVKVKVNALLEKPVAYDELLQVLTRLLQTA